MVLRLLMCIIRRKQTNSGRLCSIYFSFLYVNCSSIMIHQMLHVWVLSNVSLLCPYVWSIACIYIFETVGRKILVCSVIGKLGCFIIVCVMSKLHYDQCVVRTPLSYDFNRKKHLNIRCYLSILVEQGQYRLLV